MLGCSHSCVVKSQRSIGVLVKVLNSLDAKYILLVRVVLETESPFVLFQRFLFSFIDSIKRSFPLVF